MSEHERTDDATTNEDDSDGRTATEEAEPGSSAEEEPDDDNDRVDRSHLNDVADGSGCTEIWERLSEHRADADAE